MELMPHPKVPYDAFMPPISRAYFRCEQLKKALDIMRQHVDLLLEDLAYYYDLTRNTGSPLIMRYGCHFSFCRNITALQIICEKRW